MYGWKEVERREGREMEMKSRNTSGGLDLHLLEEEMEVWEEMMMGTHTHYSSSHQ